jgi:hypothetical protein
MVQTMGWITKGIRVDTTTKTFFEWLMNNKDNGVMGTKLLGLMFFILAKF